ncbi:hypothetical protein ACX9MO_09180 [Pseudooceanicola sp. 502str34]
MHLLFLTCAALAAIALGGQLRAAQPRPALAVVPVTGRDARPARRY